MLVLSRQRDESIMIGEDIIVMVVDIRGDKVRLGCIAPTDVPIHREEVYKAIIRRGSKSTNPRTTKRTEEGEQAKQMRALFDKWLVNSNHTSIIKNDPEGYIRHEMFAAFRAGIGQLTQQES